MLQLINGIGKTATWLTSLIIMLFKGLINFVANLI